MKDTLVLVALLNLGTARAGLIAAWIAKETGTKRHRTTVWRQLKDLEKCGAASAVETPFSSDPMPEVVWSLTDIGRAFAEQRRTQLRKAVN